MPTNVPQPSFTDSGFVSPTEADILAGVQEDMNAAFGGNLNPALETPQGQIASSLAAIIGNTDDLFCNLTKQVDPAYASGIMQDAIGRIYFIERNPAQATVVTATCTGLAGLTIPAGSLAVALDGSIYASQADALIPLSGSVDIPFACAVTGPISCPANTLTTIYQALNGWDTINNVSDGVIGTDVESRAAFEERRAQSVAQNANGSLPAVLGAVLAIDGVLDAYVTENSTGLPVTVGDFTLAAHSLYVAASGGTDTDVAQAIWSKKAPGCDYNGNTSVSVQDTNSGYSPPYPTYTVEFERPASLPVLFAINIVNSAQVPADAVTQIQNAIIAAFAGADGGARARIGSTIYATRFLSPVIALGSWAQVISLQIGSPNNSASQFTGVIAGTTLTVSGVTGAIAVGQTITGTGVADGTVILSGSGTSWVVNNSQTVASTAMEGSLANQNSVSVLIDQVPTIAAANIAVTLT